MRGLYIIATIIALLFGAASSAFASSCDVKPGPTLAPIAAQNWIDQAEFSFLMGSGRNSNMTVQKRFAKYKSSAAFKSSARNWSRTYREGRRLSNLLIQMENDVATLVSLCKRLDAASFDEVPFDFERAKRELTSIRGRINQLTQALINYDSNLKLYADVASGGAQYYRTQKFPTNPDLLIGPSPEKISSQLKTMRGRWRVIAADFRQQISPNVKIAVSPEKDTDITNIATQAQILANIIKRARSLQVNMISDTQLNQYVSGDYLYKLCPVQEGKSYKIENTYFKGRFLLDDQNRVGTLNESSMQWLIQSPILEPGRRWTFTKAGAGFWKIQSGRAAGSNRILDNAGARSFTMKSPPNRNGAYTGQLWRCYNTRWPNAYRFSNSTWSEEHSIDASANTTMTMSPTGAYGGQLWLIKPYG